MIDLIMCLRQPKGQSKPTYCVNKQATLFKFEIKII